MGLGLIVSLAACQFPLVTPAPSGPGLKLNFVVEGAASGPRLARLLLPTANTLSVSLASATSSGAVASQTVPVVAGSSVVTVVFPGVALGVYTALAKAFDPTGAVVFQQTGSLNVATGQNTITLNLIPVNAGGLPALSSGVVTSGYINAGAALSWDIPPSSLISGGYGIQLVANGPVQFFPQDSDGTLFPSQPSARALVVPQVRGGADSFITIYNGGSATESYSFVLNSSVIGTTTVNPPNNAVTLTGPTVLVIGAPATFTAAYTPAGPVNYTWYRDAAALAGPSTVNTFLFTPVAADFGGHVLTVVATDTSTGQPYSGLSFSTSLAVTVNNPQYVSTLAGDKASSGGWADDVGLLAKFNGPYDVTLVGTDLYVADRGNFVVRKVGINTGVTTTIAGIPSNGGHTDGAFGVNLLASPGGITTDGTNLYVSDDANNDIRQIVISSGVMSTVASGFSNPYGLATDGTYLYVADSGNNEIRRVKISDGSTTTLAGSVTSGSANGTGTAAQFSAPSGMATDGTNLYVADYNNNQIRQIVVSTGLVTTLAGSTTSGSIDGIGTAARFNHPWGVALGGTSLYVSDDGNHSIRKIDLSTKAVTTVAGSGSGSTDGPAYYFGSAFATFATPMGLATDGTHLFVADMNNNTIREIQ